ncbi:MAG: dihydroneopterin aldolase [Leptospiraceae bacterium]|nr:dihydroneopterin aldolase [Leptospiraceae bacterium]MDW7975948.1 dihydroneopterin aldolase [Leptospiraceae bacterium]
MKILIEELSVIMKVGVKEEERTQFQEVVFNIECEVEFSQAFVSDSIFDTINYKELYREILAFCENHSPKLLEKLAHDLGEHLLQKFHLLKSIKIQVFKPKAIVNAKRTGIEITKKRISSFDN